VEEIAKEVESAYMLGKAHAIILVAEGASIKCNEIKEALDAMDIGFTTRVSILGHIQRGGSPSAFDRLLATRMGVKAVEFLLEGSKTDVMVGLQGQSLVPVPLAEVISQHRPVNPEYFEMAKMLSI
jgi:6-phosphofructokinase 1